MSIGSSLQWLGPESLLVSQRIRRRRGHALDQSRRGSKRRGRRGECVCRCCEKRHKSNSSGPKLHFEKSCDQRAEGVMFSMEGKCEKKSVEEDRAKMSTPRVKCHAAFFPRGGSQRPTQIEALEEHLHPPRKLFGIISSAIFVPACSFGTSMQRRHAERSAISFVTNRHALARGPAQPAQATVPSIQPSHIMKPAIEMK